MLVKLHPSGSSLPAYRETFTIAFRKRRTCHVVEACGSPQIRVATMSKPDVLETHSRTGEAA